MAHGMIYDMYIWHTKSPKNNRHLCKLQHSNKSFKITFCWMDIYLGSYDSVSNTGTSHKTCAFILFSAPSMHLQYSIVFWLHKFGHNKTRGCQGISCKTVGLDAVGYVSCFSILPMMSWCQETRLALQGSTDSTFGRCPTAPRSRSKHAWRSWKGNKGTSGCQKWKD